MQEAEARVLSQYGGDLDDADELRRIIYSSCDGEGWVMHCL